MIVASGSSLRSAVVAAVLAATTAAAAEEPAAAIDFAHEIVPLLEKRCGECHIGDAHQGGFSMNTLEATQAGGDSGLAGLVPGKADASEIIRRITSTDLDERMPSDGEPLPAAEIELLAAWVAAGGNWEPGFSFESTLWEPPLEWLKRLKEPSMPLRIPLRRTQHGLYGLP